MIQKQYITGSSQSAAKLILLVILLSVASWAQKPTSDEKDRSSTIKDLCSHHWTLGKDTFEFHLDGTFVQRGSGWVGKEWSVSNDGSKVTIRFADGNGGTFSFKDGVMAHFGGQVYKKTPIQGAGAAETSIADFVGSWIVSFLNGPQNRVYRIESGGAITMIDVAETKKGTLKIVEGAAIGEWDDRMCRLTKLSDTVIKFEAFFPKSRYASKKPSSVATGRLEVPQGTKAAVPLAQASATTTAQSPEPVKSIKLKQGWDTPMQGGEKTQQDLATVLNDFGKANAAAEFLDMEIYNGVKYLMPLSEAMKVLGLYQKMPSLKKVVTPGFPRDCFNYVSFDGLFDGVFNRLDIVADTANQVVCVNLVCETPKEKRDSNWRDGAWLTYNFVGYSMRAMTTMKVQYFVEDQRSYRSSPKAVPVLKWESSQYNFSLAAGSTPLRRVNARLLDREGKVKEATRWYVPKPLADLILHCMTKAQ